MKTAQERYDAIIAHLRASPKNAVAVCTNLRTTVFKPKHADMFRVRGADLEMQSGKRWLCLNFTTIRFCKTC
jgi:hypothetical protein